MHVSREQQGPEGRAGPTVVCRVLVHVYLENFKYAPHHDTNATSQSTCTPEKACLYLRGYVGHGLTCQQRPLCTLVITPIGSAPEGSFHAWLPAALSSWQLYISIECTPTSSSMQLLPPELTE